MQVAVSPCWEEDLPDVISANLSPRAWTPTPAALVVHMLVSSHKTSAFPPFGRGRRLQHPYSDFSTAPFSRLQSFPDVQAHGCARHPGRSRRSGYLTTGRPWLLRPRLSRFVPSSSCGYASRPNRAIDGMRTFTSLDSQPCRLLPERRASGAAESGSGADAVRRRLQPVVRLDFGTDTGIIEFFPVHQTPKWSV